MKALTPRSDPVTEIFDAIAQSKKAVPGAGADCEVAVRSRTGQVIARFRLANVGQVLAFAEQALALGYHMAWNDWDGAGCYDFSVDRRAANEAIDHPARRTGD